MSESGPNFMWTGATAIIAAALLTFCWFFAIMFDPSWSFGVNLFSDLLNSDIKNVTACMLLACIIGGVLVALFGVGMTDMKGCKLSIAAGYLIVLAGVMMIFMGTLDFDSKYHVLVTAAVGLFGGLAALVLFYSDWKNGQYIAGGLTVVLFVIAIAALIPRSVPFILYDYLCFAESYIVVVGILWLFIQGFKVAAFKGKD